MSFRRERITKTVIIGLFTSLMVIGALALVSVVVLVIRSNSNDGNDPFYDDYESGSFKYQFLKIDARKKTAKSSLITLNENVKNMNEFHKSQNEDEYYLVSNIGLDEFYCSGSCYCDTNDEESLSNDIFPSRRQTHFLPSVSKGIIFLVAATTSVIAKNYATEYFKSECDTNLENECPPHAIRSEVEECQDIRSSEDKSIPSSKDDRQKEEFTCYGKCVNRVFDMDEPRREFVQQQARFFRCVDLDMTLNIDVPLKSRGDHSDSNHDYARQVFVRNLNKFCVQNSKKEVIFFSEIEEGGRKPVKDLLHMCVGEWDVNAWNPTVVCRHSNVIPLKCK